MAALRARFAAQPGVLLATREEKALALQLRRLKLQAAEAFGSVQACRCCAVGCAPPKGHWPGGRCCGTDTEVPFSADEVAALKLAGTRPGDMRPPSGDHAGCMFRSATGCSLPPEHRACLCLEYACAELKEELHTRSDWTQIQALREALHATYERFVIERAGAPPRDRSPASLVSR